MITPTFSLERFERYVYADEHQLALEELSKLLDLLNRNYGSVNNEFSIQISALLNLDEFDNHVLVRICTAITSLFSSSRFKLSQIDYGALLSWQRWVSALFSASPFRNADHVIRALKNEKEIDSDLVFDEESILKFCVLYSAESELSIDLNKLWDYNNELAASLSLVLMSPRFLGSPAAHGKREVLLEWLPDRLEQIKDVEFLPLGILHDVYMHCSYADTPRRHEIKKPINALIRKKLEQLRIYDLDVNLPRGSGELSGKPILLVVLEWFSAEHSIFRTHSRSLEGCKDHFFLVGIGDSSAVDSAGKAVFDKFIEINASDIITATTAVRNIAESLRPSALYMPSVGMFPLTMFVSNLRLAPLQLCALGHPATTHSQFIDHVVVEEDYVGKADCFSEGLIKLPMNGMPYRPSAAYRGLMIMPLEDNECIRIAVASSLMKINPRFLTACQAIMQQSGAPVQFHFFLGFAQGLIFIQARSLIRMYLPDAVIYSHQPYIKYMEAMSRCQMYVSPFPFGNTNGLVDATHLGLVGICMEGDEVFEKIDGALIRRLGLPEDLITHSIDQYIQSAVMLANDPARRSQLRRSLIEKNLIDRLFTGDNAVLGKKISNLCLNL